jgi:hypothetical protein
MPSPLPTHPQSQVYQFDAPADRVALSLLVTGGKVTDQALALTFQALIGSTWIEVGTVTVRAGAKALRRPVAEACLPGAKAWKLAAAWLSASAYKADFAFSTASGGEPPMPPGVRACSVERVAVGGTASSSTTATVAAGERLLLASCVGDTGGGTMTGGPLSSCFAPESVAGSWAVDAPGPFTVTISTVKGWSLEKERHT